MNRDHEEVDVSTLEFGAQQGLSSVPGRDAMAVNEQFANSIIHPTATQRVLQCGDQSLNDAPVGLTVSVR